MSAGGNERPADRAVGGAELDSKAEDDAGAASEMVDGPSVSISATRT
jgi:hypothetical protein